MTLNWRPSLPTCDVTFRSCRNIAVMRWYADWIHSLRERHWFSELNQGDVTAESWRIVLWMRNDFYGSHLFFCSLICVTIVIANDNFIVSRISGKWKKSWMVWQMVLTDVFKLFWIHVIIYFNTTSQILLNSPPHPPPVTIKWPSWSFKTRIFCAYFYQLFHANTYELPETQWAAVTTHLSEINDPPQINPPYLFSATC